MKTKEKLKKIACDAIDNTVEELRQISDNIWKHPELGNEEYYAHDLLTNFLERHGFQVRKHLEILLV